MTVRLASAVAFTVFAALALAGCSGSGRAKPFAVVHIDNTNAADITIVSCHSCPPVVALGTTNSFGVADVDTDWTVYSPSSLTYTVQIKGRGQVRCSPKEPINPKLPQTKTYDLRYRVTADGLCIVTRQSITP